MTVRSVFLGVGFVATGAVFAFPGVFRASICGVGRGPGSRIVTSDWGVGVGATVRTSEFEFVFVSNSLGEVFVFEFVIASNVGSGVGVISRLGSGDGVGATAADA